MSQSDTGETKPRRQRASTGEAKKALAAEIAALKGQLKERDELLEAKDAVFKEAEERLAARIYDLESQMRDKDELLRSREAELAAVRSEVDVLMNEMTRIRTENDRISSEVNKLTFELKEKKVALAKLEEEEWRAIGQRNTLRRRFGRLAKLFGR
jgi:chromosome segregation ATPase